jgi:hypothetical protein
MILRAHGQITLTGNEDDLPAAAEEEGIGVVYLGALAANAAVSVYGLAGLTTGTGVEIPKGGGHYLEVSNTTAIKVRGTAADKICWAAFDKE